MTPKPHFLALITYLTTEQGGRKTPAASGFGAKIQFPFYGEPLSGIQNFIESDKAFPGETLNAEITLLADTALFKGKIYAGMDFEFYEAEIMIGSGVIKKLVQPEGW